VVEDDVDAQRHAVLAQRGGELAQVVHRAERRFDGAVVRDRVAAVVGLGPGGEERHQVQVVDAELAQVGQPLADAGQRAPEAVGVADVAHGLLALEPVRRDLALVVEPAELGVALAGRRGHRVEQRGELCGEARVVAVEGDERVAQLGVEALQARQEGRVAVEPRAQLRELAAHLRPHGVDVLHDAGFLPASAAARGGAPARADAALPRPGVHWA
jgi:hypothetical protein